MIQFLLQIIISLAVVGALLAILWAIGAVLPVESIVTSIHTANAYVGIFYILLPLTISALGLALASLFSIESFIGLYRVSKWIYNKIPGIN